MATTFELDPILSLSPSAGEYADHISQPTAVLQAVSQSQMCTCSCSRQLLPVLSAA